jgi:hypothetical protein
MSYNRILPHKLVEYDVFKVTVQGVSWIRGVRQVRLAERLERRRPIFHKKCLRSLPLLLLALSTHQERVVEDE